MIKKARSSRIRTDRSQLSDVESKNEMTALSKALMINAECLKMNRNASELQNDIDKN
jgi:hypothetical protein